MSWDKIKDAANSVRDEITEKFEDFKNGDNAVVKTGENVAGKVATGVAVGGAAVTGATAVTAAKAAKPITSKSIGAVVKTAFDKAADALHDHDDDKAEHIGKHANDRIKRPDTGNKPSRDMDINGTRNANDNIKAGPAYPSDSISDEVMRLKEVNKATEDKGFIGKMWDKATDKVKEVGDGLADKAENHYDCMVDLGADVYDATHQELSSEDDGLGY